jgi:hypothetical protein
MTFDGNISFPAFSGDLVKMEDVGSTNVQKFNDKDFDVLRSGSYLPRLQLMTSNSEKCKAGEFPINHYALVQDQSHADLGLSVDVLVIAWRPKAMSIGDQVVSAYDHESELFKSIQEKAEQPNSGSMWGYEYLIWLPGVKKFSTFFMGSKSARREAPQVKARLGKAATLSSKKIETSSFTWFAPKCSDCSTPFEMPEREAFAHEVERFNNPVKTEVEVAPVSATRAQ